LDGRRRSTFKEDIFDIVRAVPLPSNVSWEVFCFFGFMKARLLGQSVDIRTDEQENYPSTCSFSPDGLALLTKTVADAKLRLYNTFGKSGENEIEDRTSNEVHDPVSPIRQLTTELTCDGGDAVRSTAWYPHMKSSDPTSCCFLAAARYETLRVYAGCYLLCRMAYIQHLIFVSFPMQTPCLTIEFPRK